MFTGLVEELGKVKAIARGVKSVRLTVAAKKVLQDVKLGDSIAVNGTCLTVVEYDANYFTADVMPETVDSTALANLQIGSKVNLERTLSIGDRFGGHIVSGHIDGIGIIRAKDNNDNAVIIKIEAGSEVMRYIVKKGSIAIDGISLTIVDYGQDWFTVSLIPHSASATTLGFKKTGDVVNLEADVIGKYVEKLLNLDSAQQQSKTSAINMNFLEKNGFTL
ncbi:MULTISPECIES: riboflavin synthase [Pelosinus]|jgi:riboflavin synthase|uniref:Riboflavin synthase n=1 Tax=Pelosinus fermentans B4 TaxID=1149862 RepID=I9AYW0_9FIRM|nr:MULTISPECIES: riboflavin synthase [Pelosinus]EIW18087.1 riboflavin synthase, alpha subunit [Pelosinus fermentans B4]EIW24125.1 riboflavin synthase, alpha subunit [Pelosinus fermentans A11]OAM94180.1 riboflavin synthase, alpha subunit [Pelosinus fermentans DSM 17108]SDR02274.1 riboflavin synthase alpha chain [Pelosinus fermentans]